LPTEWYKASKNGFEDQLGADKLPVKKFHLQNKKFSILINYGFFGGSIDNVDDSMFNTIINWA